MNTEIVLELKDVGPMGSGPDFDAALEDWQSCENDTIRLREADSPGEATVLEYEVPVRADGWTSDHSLSRWIDKKGGGLVGHYVLVEHEEEEEDE